MKAWAGSGLRRESAPQWMKRSSDPHLHLSPPPPRPSSWVLPPEPSGFSEDAEL